MPKTYYGKSYHFSQLHHRMKLIAENCDYMMIITNEDKMNLHLVNIIKDRIGTQHMLHIQPYFGDFGGEH